MWSSDCPVANPVILNLTPKMTKKETRRHWKKKVKVTKSADSRDEKVNCQGK